MATRSSSKFARRRKNALLAVAVLALLLIVIVVIIIVSVLNKGKNDATGSASPTPTGGSMLATLKPTLPTALTLATLPADSPTATIAPSSPTTTPNVSGEGTTMYVTGDGVRVRESASTSGNTVTTLSKGTAVTAYTKSGDWYSVKLSNGSKGYISASYLTSTKPSATAKPTAKPTTAPTTAPTSAAITSLTQIGLPSSADKVLDVSRATYNSYLTTYTKIAATFSGDNFYVYKMSCSDETKTKWIAYSESKNTSTVHDTYEEAYAQK